MPTSISPISRLPRRRHRSRLAAAALATLFLATATVAARADTDSGSGAVAFAQKLGNTAIAKLTDRSLGDAARVKRMRQLLRDSFDVPAVSKFVLGKYRRRATPEQVKEFEKLYTTYVAYNYAGLFKKYDGQKVKMESAEGTVERRHRRGRRDRRDRRRHGRDHAAGAQGAGRLQGDRPQGQGRQHAADPPPAVQLDHLPQRRQDLRAARRPCARPTTGSRARASPSRPASRRGPRPAPPRHRAPPPCPPRAPSPPRARAILTGKTSPKAKPRGRPAWAHSNRVSGSAGPGTW